MQEAFVFDTLRVMFLGVALLILVSTLFAGLTLSGGARIVAIILGLLLAGLFYTVHRLVADGRIPNGYSHPLAAGLGAVGFSYQLYQMVFDKLDVTAMQLVGLALTTIAAGAVYLSFRWLLGTLIVVFGSWSVTLLLTESNAVLSEHIYLYAILLLFSLFIFYGRSRAIAAMISAQLANQRQNQQLSETLERAHLSEATLRAERDYADQIVESMGQGLVLVDAEGRIEFANPAAEEIIQHTTGSLVGRPVSEIMNAESETTGGAGTLAEASRDLHIVGIDGAERNVMISSTQRPGGGSIIALTDLTLRKQFESELQRLAHHDALTGLPNRALFMDRITQALSRLDRFDARIAVLFMDLDRFKWINDTLGHAVGDQVLVECARRIKHCIRDHDTAARFGGDEFVVLLTELEDADEALSIAARISRHIQEPLTLQGRSHIVETSIGIAMTQSRDKDPESLINQADIAMYQAKSRRDLNRVLFTPGMDTRLPDNIAFEQEAQRSAATYR
jgi:diguanylate cyclase (GGDEF)-like protein/PAS domain S-box-containing protein